VYIARLRDGRFSVGISQQGLKTLLAEHQDGRHACFTERHRIVRILWTESHASLPIARQREVQPKRWTHAKKLALITGDFAELRRLSRSRQRRHPIRER
jgi:predicted GIY-YIG superfamily endonuclease